LVFSFKTMLGFLTSGGGAGAESGRGLRALTGPVADAPGGAAAENCAFVCVAAVVCPGAGEADNEWLGAAEGRGFLGGELCRAASARGFAGLGGDRWIALTFEKSRIFNLMSFFFGGPSTLVVLSGGAGRFGGRMAPVGVVKDNRTLGDAAGAAVAGGLVDWRGLILVRILLVCVNSNCP